MLQALFDQEALLFTVPALLGTAVFLVRLGLMTIVGLDHDMDVPHDVDIPHDVAIDAQGDVDLGHDVESGDSTAAFNLLSIQSVAAFLMGFGWGGVGGLLGFEWSFPMSLLVGVGFGALLVWLLGILMKAMYDLQSSGNVRVEDAVGVEGQVYANVPAGDGGRGQVRVVISDRARIYNAVSDGDAIKTGSRVRVVRVNEDRTLTVTAV
jgi:membrane protein implicated in regulation of membrane protease activity